MNKTPLHSITSVCRPWGPWLQSDPRDIGLMDTVYQMIERRENFWCSKLGLNGLGPRLAAFNTPVDASFYSLPQCTPVILDYEAGVSCDISELTKERP